MKLVVLGKEDLTTLESWVMSLFCSIPNFNKPVPSWLPHMV